MALSQLQCLDDGHVNYRVNVAKPEFFYSEAQRLAVEVLVAEGIHAFHQTVAKESLREFLSHLDIQQILSSVRDFHREDPPPAPREVEDQGGDDVVGQGEQEGKPLSLRYWPESSDVSRPGLDLGWPDCASYRGVTRANVYTQPPLDGSMHIKEMFRRMISQAQKVIAVAMDIFTDIDIFKDLLDASFRRKIPVYIIHDEANIEYFMKMCDDAQMHAGMLKNLRVYTINGTDFTTRSAKTIVGRQMQKFLLVDGDRAASGSYSFTWTASRLDRNIITVLSGQAVEIFDNQFRELLHFSKPVNLQQLNLAPEEEPPELAQPVVTITAEQTAAIAKKLINPKYALVKANNMGSLSSEKKADSNGAGKKALGAPAKAQSIEEGSYIHPALVNMPKVNMFHYLPTYLELPQEENQQEEAKASKRESCQRNAAKACKASADSSQQAARQKETACESPDPAQPNAENGWELELTSEAGMEVPEVKEKPSAAWGKEKVTMTLGPSRNVNHPEQEKEEEVQTIVTDTMQVDPEATTDGLDGEELVDGVLDVSDGEESDTEEALASNEGESEDVIECIGVDPDQNALPGEENEARLKDECPSNSSTNDTPDWNTDSSSLREQSIASSDSDDFYDCVHTQAHRKMSSPAISQANNQVANQEENNIFSQGIFGRPLNDFKELSHSMNDIQDCKISEHKSLEAFFNDKDNTRKRALNKLKISLEINYLDKFKRDRYTLPTARSTGMWGPNANDLSSQAHRKAPVSPDLGKSRRQISMPMASSLLSKNYQKVASHLSIPKGYEQKRYDIKDTAAKFGAGNSAAQRRNPATQRRNPSSADPSVSGTMGN
ncbi:protein FAM83G [Amblyraja radiata]|uniref:protein FAM83G n=1 Tax=Amblyraja radiata TaxID=386614 RepID=UPI001404077D|nr:protein FAM83G [Amblyraja radiata]